MGVLELVLAAIPAPPAGRPTLVAIEGMGGAGKSHLAALLASAREDVTVVHADDFYGPEERDWRSWTAEQGYQRYFDHRRLEAEVLQPLWRGDPGQFQRYDWNARALDGMVTVLAEGVVVVEGVYVLRPRLRRYWHLSVLVSTPRKERQRRLTGRGENDPGWVERWTAVEDHYLRVEPPDVVADLIVPGY